MTLEEIQRRIEEIREIHEEGILPGDRPDGGRRRQHDPELRTIAVVKHLARLSRDLCHAIHEADPASRARVGR